jgi:selenocysteine lyase/cysteine desulfurase
MTASLIPAARDLFEIPDDVTYLNCAGMAPHLRNVTEAGLRAVRAQTAPWNRTVSDWFSGAEELRSLVAHLLNATADAIALVSSASYGLATAAANVPISSGQTIVLIDEEFPSQVYVWRELAKKKNARVVTAAPSPDQTWTEALSQFIDNRTAVVAVTPCHWMDGARIDLDVVSARARDVGAALVVDASQYLGAAPMDVARIQPDFLVSVGYKWLLGPYALGYLYAAPRWRERGTPLEHSWLARAGAETFARPYSDDFRPGARRFDMGAFPQFTLVPMAIAALRQVLEWTPARISATLATITSAAADRAKEAGFEVLPPDQRVPHILGLRLPHGRRSITVDPRTGDKQAMTASQISSQLASAKIYISAPGDALRVSPHVYSSARDFDQLFAALTRILEMQ